MSRFSSGSWEREDYRGESRTTGGERGDEGKNDKRRGEENGRGIGKVKKRKRRRRGGRGRWEIEKEGNE